VSRSDNLVWIDLEMSGLDPTRERILEAAVIVTTSELEVVAEGPNLVIHQPDEVLERMDEWNREHHGASGLTERVRSSALGEREAEERLLAFVREYCDERSCPLAGNSVHLDREFLKRYMPALTAFLHYRIVDVSTIKELARRWFPAAREAAPPKKSTHRALDDIRESIEELRYYRQAIFRQT
jgi:oligoribonuclease